MIRNSTLFLIIISLFLLNKSIHANEKQKIIDNINNIETLKFNFNQMSIDEKEEGECFLKRPHFLKCIYEDKNQKQLIVNKNKLIIYHARYNKSYFYPVKTSYFLDILNKKKFENLILAGLMTQNNNDFEIKYLDENKGKIKFFFDLNSFDLKGWEIVSLNGSKTIFKLDNLLKNQELNKRLFELPNPS